MDRPWTAPVAGPAGRRIGIVAAAACFLALPGCGGGPDLSGPDDDPAPGTASLEVRSRTTGDTLDADGYLSFLGGGDGRSLPVDGSVLYRDLEPGTYELEIAGVARNCRVDGALSRVISLEAGDESVETVTVRCRAALRDRIVFTGAVADAPDPLWAVAADGTGSSRITEDHTDLLPAVSPDGTRVALARLEGGNVDLWVMNADGTDPRRLTDHPADDWMASWSPDGERIVFASERSGSYQLWTVDADGGEPVGITDLAAGAWVPDWSPEGDRIVFTTRSLPNEIRYVNPDGTGLTGPVGQMGSASMGEPVWSPDGTRLAFTVFPAAAGEDSDIWTMAPDGSSQQRVTVDDARDESPAWSGDGSRLVFVSERAGAGGLWIADLLDGTVSRLPLPDGVDGGRYPDWAP
jgi:tricorn protease-like protein